MQKFVGTGGCLIACIANLLYMDESMFKEIRQQFHLFLENIWDLIGWAEYIKIRPLN